MCVSFTTGIENAKPQAGRLRQLELVFYPKSKQNLQDLRVITPKNSPVDYAEVGTDFCAVG